MQFEQGTIVTHENGVRASGIMVPPPWRARCGGMMMTFCYASTNQLRMPILPSEPDIFPAELLDGLDIPDASDVQWWAMYTMARREKELMRRLRALEIPFYSPLVPRRTRSPGGRVRQSYVPLFASYVFVHGSQQQRHQALTTNCVSRCLSVDDGVQLLRDLRQIRRLIALDAPLTIEARIEPGRRVRVRSGSMAGLEGTVVKRRGKDWLLVAIEFLQQGASVLLEDFQVEPL
jgi:transcriptional antiterminator RfaH